MKRKILTLLFAILAIIAYSQNNVVTISGLVTTPAGTAVPNHEIFISADSSNFQPFFNYFHQVYTDANGFYIDTISIVNQGVVYTKGGFNVSTFDCMNTYKLQSVSFGPNLPYSMNANFSICDSIFSQSCNASFYAGKDSANNFTYYFSSNSTGVNNNTQYSWNFGDSTIGTGLYTTHTFPSNGTYYVCLTISGDSCQSSYCNYVTVGNDTLNTGCQAYFYMHSDSLNGSNNSTFTAVDASLGNPISWNWSFGDGTSSNAQSPMHTFSPGTYYVCLAITTASGCSSTYCDYVNVYSQDSTMCNLYVSISVSNETYPGADNGTATVTNVYGGTPPYLYNWSNGAMTQSISGLTQGYYNVSVTDSKGCFTMATVDVLDASDSINWNNVDTLITNPIDTCLTFPISNASIYSFTILNSNTVAITWIVYNAQGTSYSYISVQYTFGTNGNYQIPLVISCDSSKGTTYNFYAPLHLSSATGIIEAKPSSVSLNVFPNPVTDNLNISIDKSLSGTTTVSILNLMGQVIQTTNVANETSGKVITLNTSSLPKGLYFVQLNCNGQIETGKFAK